MEHPSSEKMIDLGNRFVDIHNLSNLSSDNLDFHQSLVKTVDECGTVACHGGWGHVLFKQENISEHPNYAPFEHGAAAIARFLGFSDKCLGFDSYDNFAKWARLNPELWGNIAGGSMFHTDGHRAFGYSFPDDCTLENIGQHYIAVGERLKTLEDTNDETS